MQRKHPPIGGRVGFFEPGAPGSATAPRPLSRDSAPARGFRQRDGQAKPAMPPASPASFHRAASTRALDRAFAAPSATSSRAAVTGALTRAGAPEGLATPQGLTADPAHNVPPSAASGKAQPADVTASFAVHPSSTNTLTRTPA